MLANNVLIGGCAEIERDFVVHAHQVHRVQQTVRGLQNCCGVQKNKYTSGRQNSRVQDTTESVTMKTYVSIWKEHLGSQSLQRPPNDDQLKSVVVVFVEW